MDCGLELREQSASQTFWKTLKLSLLGATAIAAFVVIQMGEAERKASKTPLKNIELEAGVKPATAS